MITLPENIKYVINTLENKGFKAYIVGGCVRDFLLNKTPTDYDITTSATPEEIIKLFPKTIPTGIKHGTVTVIINNENIEVTTFRSDGAYSDNRHPENVQFVTDIKFDLSRRDFTVNAMSYNETDGLIDFFGGKDDIKMKILKAVGEPKKRFSEDALRILRLFRFSSVLGFEMEKETLFWAKKLSVNLEKISKERIFIELKKAIMGDYCENLTELILCGGLKFLGVNNVPNFNILKKCKNNESLCLFSFFYLCNCNILDTLNTLKVSNKIKNYCKKLENLLKIPFPNNKAEIKQILSISSPEFFKDYLHICSLLNKDISVIQNLFNQIIDNDEPYLISHLDIKGDDLITLGYSGGEIGEKLEYLKNEVIKDSTINQKEKLINKLKLYP